jgi:uncharacterized membrane protein
MRVDVEATKPWLRGIWVAILAVSAVLLSVRAGVYSLVRYLQHETEIEEREREENEDNGDQDGEWGGERMDKRPSYLNFTILQLLYVVFLSPAPNTYRLPLRCTIYAIVTLELMVSVLVASRQSVNHTY